MKTINSANVTVLASKVVVNLQDGTIVADLSPTVWVGTGYDNVTATLRILDPAGIVLASSILAAPLTESVQASLPVIDGLLKSGNYSAEVTLIDGSSSYKDINTRKVISPCSSGETTGVIGTRIKAKCNLGKTLVYVSEPPQYQSVEATSYTQAVEYYYPNGSGEPDINATFSPFYVKLKEGRNEVIATVVGTYEFENNFSILVPFTGQSDKNVICVSDLAAAFIAIDILRQRYDASCDSIEQERITAVIDEAIKLIVTIELGDEAGADTGYYVAQLEKLLKIDLSCPGVPEMSLTGIPADTVVIEGCGVTEEVAGYTKKFTINNYTYLIALSNEQGALIQTNGADGCTKTTTLTFDWGKVADLVLTQFEGSKNARFIAIINNALKDVDPLCVATAANWKLATFAQKLSLMITKMCDCCGETPTGPTLEVTLDCESAVVTEEFLVGEASSGTIVIPVDFVGSGTISGSVIGSGFTGTLAATDVTEANTTITLPIVYSGSGSAGSRNATITINYPGNKTKTCVIPIIIDEVAGCTAAINPSIAKVSNTITVSFNPATEEPDDYQVSRRLKSDPDSPAYYTTLAGSPVYNMGLGKYELNETWTSAEINKVWIYKVTSLCASGSRPFVTVEYIYQSCPVITLGTADGTTVTYSFPHVGGQINQYRVAIYQGLTLIGSIQTKAVSPSPVTGSFTGLSASTAYTVKVYSEITGTDYSLECTASISTGVADDSWSISYTNNDPALTNIEVHVGNNGGSPSTLLFDGVYYADPLTGTNPILPAVNMTVQMNLGNLELVSANCNGVNATITGPQSCSWTGINGSPLAISFITTAL